MKATFAATLLLALPIASCLSAQVSANTAASASSMASTGVLSAADVSRLMPATVFFQGQSAPIQMRNAAGVHLDGKAIFLAALVDTSGYSTSVQARYQAYLITENQISIEGHNLPAGAYGVGFLPNDQFVVMDIGGHDLFLAHSTPDAAMPRPRPLQITADLNKPGQFRLYEGRAYVSFLQASARQ